MARKLKTVISLRISMEVPEGSNVAQAMQYVRDAIGGWKGGMDPENPLFELQKDTITVSLLKKETFYS